MFLLWNSFEFDHEIVHVMLCFLSILLILQGYSKGSCSVVLEYKIVDSSNDEFFSKKKEVNPIV